ncbi:MAG: hypothetical protein CMO55_12350 [Verrucomicrobiales bacterium]|nr:hypothetical protein [Verrucomicrobiales bacterium]
MKRTALWLSLSILFLVAVGYLALTVGTRPFLPEEWKAIQVGMPREEVHELIPNTWGKPSYHTKSFGPLIVASTPREWTFSRHGLDKANWDYIIGRIGLRGWHLGIGYQNGAVAELKISHRDEVNFWGSAIQAWVNKLTGSDFGTSPP